MSLWDLDILYNIAICNRFHGLIEFDEGKRSCRRRLAGHNERRRKPQPDAFGLHTRFLPAFQGMLLLGTYFKVYSEYIFLMVALYGTQKIQCVF